jgi:hypothetical protein
MAMVAAVDTRIVRPSTQRVLRRSACRPQDSRGIVAQKVDYSAFHKLQFPQHSLFFVFVPLWTRTPTASSTPRRKEAHQMLSPRWLARLAIPVMAGAALVSSAAIATADPRDDAYLSQLRAAGFSWPPEHDAALTATGRLICDDIMWGWTYDQIAQNIHATLDPRNVTFGDVHAMVTSAHSAYCGDFRCWTAQC